MPKMNAESRIRAARWTALHVYYRNMERIKPWIAARLPRWLVYRATIRLVSEVTTGKYSRTVVDTLTAMEAIKRWEDR